MATYNDEDVAPVPLINTNNDINTFSQDSLSVQYDRETEQVPFMFGIRGPTMLRGRTEAPVVKVGDKKS